MVARWGWRHAICDGADIVAARKTAAEDNDRKQRALSSARAARRYTSGSGVEVIAPDGSHERIAPYKRKDIRPLAHAAVLAERLERKANTPKPKPEQQDPAVD